MNIRLHANATTTPKTRRYIQELGRALLPQEETTEGRGNAFNAYAPDVVHVDIKYLPEMPEEERNRYLCVAVERASRWVYVERRASKSARAAGAFLNVVQAKTPLGSRSCSPTATRLSPIASAVPAGVASAGRTASTGASSMCCTSTTKTTLPPVRRHQDGSSTSKP